jgi:methionyl-tRNA formyltransferase
MNLGLFASGNVGLRIAQFLAAQKEPVRCLALDSQDKSVNNEKICEAIQRSPGEAIWSDTLHSADSIALLRSLDLDLIILAWWPYLVKSPILEMPRHGCLNFHPSLLPFNRGKNYNFWTIVEDTPFGVTLHFADSGVDSGDIAFQARIEKSWEDTGQTLYAKAQEAMVQLFIDNFQSIKAGRIPRIPQHKKDGSFHRSGEMASASEIHLDRKYPARDLLNLLRARTFRPHPACYFVENGVRYEARIEITRVGNTNDNR